MMPANRPLGITVPLVLLIVGTLLIGGYYLAEHATLDDSVRSAGRQELRMFAALSSGDIELAYRNGDRAEALASLERLGGLPRLSRVALVDAEGSIIQAGEPGQRGQSLWNYLNGLGSEQIRQILARPGIHILDHDGGLRQTGFFPVYRRASQASFLPVHLGWLVMENDLAAMYTAQRNQLLRRAAVYAGVLLVLSAGLWWLFRRRLLYRIQQLVSATREIAMGDFTAVPDIGGRDELSQLSDAFAQMAHRLQENTDELAFLGGHDRLTGLLNRRGFEQGLETAVREAGYGGRDFLLLYLDLDSFRVLNDTQGHAAGDELIVQLADLLRERLGNAVALGRIGGDEFAVLLLASSDRSPEVQAQQLHDIVTGLPFRWQGQPYHVQASIGVALIDGALSGGEVLSRADTACYAAKDGGRNRIQVWRDDEQELLQHHGQMKWVGRIQSALETGRLELHGQPIKPLQESEPGLHFEVLVRMRDEQGRLIPPGEFLPAAERFQLATRIDRWVIEQTFRQLSDCGAGIRHIHTCAINLSGPSLGDEAVTDAIRRGFSANPGIRPNQLCFEVTETAAITNLFRAVHFIEELRGLDCRIALDDFGSGVSSFGYLKNLPVDIIKIDGSFVRELPGSSLGAVITRSINDIAHEMGKRTVAEFAETTQVIQALRRMGVDYAQGYGVARPTLLSELLREGLRRAG